MRKFKVAITVRSFGINVYEIKEFAEKFEVLYINTTGRRLSENELLQVLKGAEGVIAGTEPFTKQVIESLSDLKVISRVGVGLDSIDLDTAERIGIKILNTPKAPIQAVAEHTLALILDLLKHIAIYNQKIRAKDYSIKPGQLLSGKQIGIVGLGRIGHRVATLLDAFGCKINYYDPWVNDNAPDHWKSESNLEQLLMESDIISLHIPQQANGKPLLDEVSLSLTKKGAIIINTARGSLIDEEALIKALISGQISAAGLDVVLKEPYSGKLLEFPQVIMTPHVASNTIESRQQMEIEAVNNMIEVLGVKP
jgi:D-3-phosphoglycerate dehydrogenase / 2-oxoglutarate reductase